MSPSKAMKSVMEYLSVPVNMKARASHSPNNRNSNNTGYREIWYRKGYYRKVIKKNGKWVAHPTNKKWYVKVGPKKFHAPNNINYWSK
jgi:hypothetical protein